MLPDPVRIFLIYLPYGAVFFAIGVAITSRRKLFKNLNIAGLFWLLAGFAFVHALHEWLEMFRHLKLTVAEPIVIYTRHVSLLTAFVSFLFLFLFGTTLIAAIRQKTKLWLYLFFGTVVGLFLFHLLMQLPWRNPDLLRTIEYDMRLLIALPSTLLTGIGFFLYARQLKEQNNPGSRSFLGAGCAFILYGICAGAIPSGTSFVLPIEIWRALSAFVILYFIMCALDNFMDQREGIISRRLQLAGNSEKLSAVGRLAAGIAHEINNPLANASLQLELLRQQPEITTASEKTLNRIQIIEQSIDRASHIAREVLVFAGGKNPSTEHVPVDLSEAILSAWNLVSYRAKNHHFDFQLPQLPPIDGNYVKLEELFLNLMINAIDAMPKGGTITCTGHSDDDSIHIQLVDEGIGIAPEHRDQILEPFFTTKEVGQGTGLGLSICYGIMQLYGGTIELVPRNKQPGTSANLTFPKSSFTTNPDARGKNG